MVSETDLAVLRHSLEQEARYRSFEDIYGLANDIFRRTYTNAKGCEVIVRKLDEVDVFGNPRVAFYVWNNGTQSEENGDEISVQQRGNLLVAYHLDESKHIRLADREGNVADFAVGVWVKMQHMDEDSATIIDDINAGVRGFNIETSVAQVKRTGMGVSVEMQNGKRYHYMLRDDDRSIYGWVVTGAAK